MNYQDSIEDQKREIFRTYGADGSHEIVSSREHVLGLALQNLYASIKRSGYSIEETIDHQAAKQQYEAAKQRVENQQAVLQAAKEVMEQTVDTVAKDFVTDIDEWRRQQQLAEAMQAVDAAEPTPQAETEIMNPLFDQGLLND